MEFRNNNRQVEKELAEAYYQTNRVRNRLVIFTIALAVILLYGAFAIADGKIRSDYLIDVRGMGTVATVSVENGSQKQYEQMQTFSYLSDIGLKKTVTSGTFDDIWTGNFVYLDSTAYEKLFCPAFTDIYGHYPVEEDEILMPVRVLEQLKVDKPELNMKILMRIYTKAGEQMRTFRLAGYYTDYIDSSISIPEVYVSKAFADEYLDHIFPVDKIMAAQSADVEGAAVEQWLYSDLQMEYDSQQVFGENPMTMQSIEGVFGSTVIAVTCGLLVILCAFLMIYNVVSISIGREIRQYGLLKVIGTTNVQLCRIARRQNYRNIFLGVCAGSVIGCAAVKLFLPQILRQLFMYGLGESDVSGFSPKYLALAVVLTTVASLSAMGFVLKKVTRWEALKSLKYIDADVNYEKEEIRSCGNISMKTMAWRNVTRSKKRLLISVLSLVLGGIVVLGAVVITTGSNLQNQIKENPDFKIGILAGIFRFPEKVPEEINDDTPVLSEGLVKQMQKLGGIKENTIQLVKGSYATIDFAKDEALLPRKKSLETAESDLQFATLQIVEEDFISELETYVQENHFPVDIESLKNGTGCILLHYHEMSEILEKEAAEICGMPIHFYSLNAYGEQGDKSAFEKGTLNCAGYLDFTAKYFPKLQTTSMGNQIHYFIMTKKAFDSLGFPEKTFDMCFDAEEEEQVMINQKLQQLVQQENRKSGEMDTFYVHANYTILQAEQNRIDTANIILGALAYGIMLIGILNYCHTILANQSIRKREFATMISIGLTKKQLWKMLMWEGMYYWVMIMGGLVTIGSLIVIVLARMIQKKLLYFKFVYPLTQIVLFAVIMLAINFVLTTIIYSGSKKWKLNLRIED